MVAYRVPDEAPAVDAALDLQMRTFERDVLKFSQRGDPLGERSGTQLTANLESAEAMGGVRYDRSEARRWLGRHR